MSGGILKIFTGILKLAIIVVGQILGGPVGAFIGAIIGSLLEYAILSVFTKRSSTNTEQSSVNVRVSEPIRWLAAGKTRLGGAVMFADFDAGGNLWYLVVHGDSPMGNRHSVLLDETPISLDGSGNVLNKEYRLNSKFEPVTTDGAGDAYIQVWTTTFTQGNPTPPPVSAFSAAMGSKWTSDHKLVGTTFTVVRMKALIAEHRYKIYKWRGPLGLGEPSVALIADWAYAYDPRDEDQDLNDRTTYKFTRNAALVWGWFRTHPYGFNKPLTSINWSKVASEADICDQSVTGIHGIVPRYTCDIRAPEDRERGEVQQEILACMDGVIMYDDEGKAWPRAGRYEAPTLTLRRNRDILGMESVEAVNGESETQGVIVRYSDPASNYSLQPSAAWLNPNYYIEGEAATFLTIEVGAITSHNQAMRIAKSVGLRVQPTHKLAPTCGLRGLKARHERIVSLLYDNTFSGEYEICTQVELDAAGVLTRFGIVPIDENRWNLLEGEEKPKPVIDGEAVVSGVPDSPSVGGSIITNSRLFVTFDVSTREDVGIEAQYIPTDDMSSGSWLPMTVDPSTNEAFTPPITDGVDYTYRYRSVSASGHVSDWQEQAPLTAPVPIGPCTNFTADFVTAEIQVTWRNPVSVGYDSSDVYRGTTSVFGSATLIVNVAGAAGAYGDYVDTPLLGLHYYWVVARATDGGAATEVGPVTATMI